MSFLDLCGLTDNYPLMTLCNIGMLPDASIVLIHLDIRDYTLLKVLYVLKLLRIQDISYDPESLSLKLNQSLYRDTKL